MFMNNGSDLLASRSIAEIKLVVGGGLIPYYDPDGILNMTSIAKASFGLSWFWQTLSDGHWYIGHTGSIPGGRHWILVDEQNSIGVIFLSNADQSVPGDRSVQLHKTLENILLLLFRCFEPNVNNSSDCSPHGTLLSLLIFLILPFFTLL